MKSFLKIFVRVINILLMLWYLFLALIWTPEPNLFEMSSRKPALIHFGIQFAIFFFITVNPARKKSEDVRLFLKTMLLLAVFITAGIMFIMISVEHLFSFTV